MQVLTTFFLSTNSNNILLTRNKSSIWVGIQKFTETHKMESNPRRHTNQSEKAKLMHLSTSKQTRSHLMNELATAVQAVTLQPENNLQRCYTILTSFNKFFSFRGKSAASKSDCPFPAALPWAQTDRGRGRASYMLLLHRLPIRGLQQLRGNESKTVSTETKSTQENPAVGTFLL